MTTVVGDQVTVAVDPDINDGQAETVGFVTALVDGRATVTALCAGQRLVLTDVEIHPNRTAFEAAHEKELDELLTITDMVDNQRTPRYRREHLAKWVNGCWPRPSTVATQISDLTSVVNNLRGQVSELRSQLAALTPAPVE
jgi:hypothetical protein